MTTTPHTEFWRGVKATLPMVVGAIPFGIIFGAVAVNSGLSTWATAAMSAFVFAGSSQFVAAGLVAKRRRASPSSCSPPLWSTCATASTAATLAPHVKHLPQRWLLPLGFTGSPTRPSWSWPNTTPGRVTLAQPPLVLSWLQRHHVYELASLHLDRHCRRPVAPKPRGLGAGLCVGGDLYRHVDAGAAHAAHRDVQHGGGCSGAAGGWGLPNQLGLMVAALAGVAAGILTERLAQGGRR
jgi:hypothetical protein